MAFAHLMLAYYYFARNHDLTAPSTMALGALGIYLLGFSLGMGPIPWLLLAEIFPTDVRGVAASIATATNWTSSFVVTLTFEPIEDAIGESATFLAFALMCLCALIFVAVLVPETKGRSVEQVLAFLKGRNVHNVDISLQREAPPP
jgi:SP family facilitated glucose transporter-like MFS transporter 8